MVRRSSPAEGWRDTPLPISAWSGILMCPGSEEVV